MLKKIKAEFRGSFKENFFGRGMILTPKTSNYRET